MQDEECAHDDRRDRNRQRSEGKGKGQSGQHEESGPCFLPDDPSGGQNGRGQKGTEEEEGGGRIEQHRRWQGVSKPGNTSSDRIARADPAEQKHGDECEPGNEDGRHIPGQNGLSESDCGRGDQGSNGARGIRRSAVDSRIPGPGGRLIAWGQDSFGA